MAEIEEMLESFVMMLNVAVIWLDRDQIASVSCGSGDHEGSRVYLLHGGWLTKARRDQKY